MAVIATESSRVLVQGITGQEPRFRTLRMKEYGTEVVAGTSPGKGGATVHGTPVYNTVREALENHPQINTSVVMVGAAFALDAALEAIEANLESVVVLAEGIPAHDSMIIKETAQKARARVVGPNSPGLISPGICELGATAHSAFHGPGKVGIVSVTGSGQWYLSRLVSVSGLGVSTFLGIGGDPVKFTDITQAMLLFEDDPQTQGMLLVSEIGGTQEMELARMVEAGQITKPIVAYMYGRTAPEGTRMGHAGAIIKAGLGDIRSKAEAMQQAGIRVILYPWEVVGAFLEAGLEPDESLYARPWREAEVGR
ncbi:MAG: succinate--CoA ligase subunit alpha [Deltaproteobacteria bacterium]|nr:succinate--CoA ligase subunit alpha [Deltaproteobacteria bacterium]